MAASSSSASAASANISHSYNVTGSIPNGTIVSLDPQRSGYVDLANNTNDTRLLGVVLPSSQSLLAVDPTSSKTQVATNGTVDTLVSTLNGNIEVGDQISTSPFSGVGIKASPGTEIVGIAQTAFTNSSVQATAEQVKDKAGKIQSIKVGYIRLTIAIGAKNAAIGSDSQANFLQKLVKSLTGRSISTVRILLGLTVALISIIFLATLIYASIYGSVISIGRNPLAQNAVFRTLASVMTMVFLTATIACVTIYYLLR